MKTTIEEEWYKLLTKGETIGVRVTPQQHKRGTICKAWL
jgi:hypothetical protein